MKPIPLLTPQWDAPPSILAFATTRAGGVSAAPYGLADGRTGGLNLADHVGDDPHAVQKNRSLVNNVRAPRWLKQVHANRVCDLDALADDAPAPEADASITTRSDRTCVILVADCMPVLLADRGGAIVGAAHAGWRGVVSSAIVNAISAMRMRVPQCDLTAWIGPCIGQDAFEIGPEVRDALIAAVPHCESAFKRGNGDRWHADLPAIATLQLVGAGVRSVATSGLCTVSDAQRFYSYRRDGRTGRFAAFIALADQ